MSDEPIPDEPVEPQPLHLTTHQALTIEDWPAAIEVNDAMLEQAYRYGATHDPAGDTLRFAIGNGEAIYALRRDRKYGRGFVAELREGNDKRSLAARRRKFETGATEES